METKDYLGLPPKLREKIESIEVGIVETDENVASNEDRIKVLEDMNFVYSNSGTLFVSYSSITEQGITSTFRGFKTRMSYSNESIKAINVSFNLEKSGYEVICEVWNDSNVLLASKTVMCNSSGRQNKMFIFDTVITSSLITTSNFYVSVRTVAVTGCRLHPGYIEGSARMTGSADHQNYYITLGNTGWSGVGSGGFAGAFEFISEAQIVVGYPDAMFTQSITNWEQDISLPTTLYLTVGKEFNVYFENIISDDVSKYFFDVGCDIGIQQNERWTCIPSIAGTYGWTLAVYDKMMNQIKSVGCTLLVSAAASNSGVTKTCLCIGDSLTAAGEYTGELLTLCGVGDVMNLTLLGTQGSSTNLYEGYSGWAVSNFVGASSPFYSGGAFNFSAYMTAHSYTVCDWVFIFLGVNDIFNYSTDTGVDALCVSNKANIDSMIASIKAWNSTVKVCLMLPCTGSATQDAFGKNYNSNQLQMRYKRNIHRYSLYLIEQYKDRTAERIYMMASNANIDTRNNMVTETVAVNSRNATTVVRQANGVHPDSSGYYQIADTIFYFLKNDV
jgi:lysophospholipase L1-like esterase